MAGETNLGAASAGGDGWGDGGGAWGGGGGEAVGGARSPGRHAEGAQHATATTTAELAAEAWGGGGKRRELGERYMGCLV